MVINENKLEYINESPGVFMTNVKKYVNINEIHEPRNLIWKIDGHPTKIIEINDIIEI